MLNVVVFFRKRDLEIQVLGHSHASVVDILQLMRFPVNTHDILTSYYEEDRARIVAFKAMNFISQNVWNRNLFVLLTTLRTRHNLCVFQRVFLKLVVLPSALVLVHDYIALRESKAFAWTPSLQVEICNIPFTCGDSQLVVAQVQTVPTILVRDVTALKYFLCFRRVLVVHRALKTCVVNVFLVSCQILIIERLYQDFMQGRSMRKDAEFVRGIFSPEFVQLHVRELRLKPGNVPSVAVENSANIVKIYDEN